VIFSVAILTYLSFTVALEIEVIQDFQDEFILLKYELPG